MHASTVRSHREALASRMAARRGWRTSRKACSAEAPQYFCRRQISQKPRVCRRQISQKSRANLFARKHCPQSSGGLGLTDGGAAGLAYKPQGLLCRGARLARCARWYHRAHQPRPERTARHIRVRDGTIAHRQPYGNHPDEERLTKQYLFSQVYGR